MDRVIYGDYIVNRRFFLFTVVWPVVASPNRASGHLGGWWATPWSAEEMLDGQHQTVDIAAHATTAHWGHLQQRLEKSLLNRLSCPPPSTLPHTPRRPNR